MGAPRGNDFLFAPLGAGSNSIAPHRRGAPRRGCVGAVDRDGIGGHVGGRDHLERRKERHSVREETVVETQAICNACAKKGSGTAGLRTGRQWKCK